MRALLGFALLLISLAIGGLVAVRQLKSVGKAGSSAAAAEAGLPVVPQMSGSGTARGPSRELQRQLADDVAKAMKQGAEARQDASEKQ